MEIDKIFTGYDCVDQFVEWIGETGIISRQLFAVD